MERKTQTGFLVLADISGYTSFVAQTEIDHAENVISPLLETIIEKLEWFSTGGSDSGLGNRSMRCIGLSA